MDPITLFVLFAAGLWLMRVMAEELWAALRGRESPAIARRRAREELTREFGTTTMLQELSNRMARRIANPPHRRRLAALRALLDEMWADALEESRVRHHVAHEIRMRRARQARPDRPPQSGWIDVDATASPPDDVVDGVLCPGCGEVTVFPPDQRCDACEAHPPYTWPPAPDPDDDPDPVDDHTEHPDPSPEDPAPPTERTTMPTARFPITGDVRDPRTALNAAEVCRGANNAIAAEMDILLNNMRQVELGADLLAAIAGLADDQRTYADSNAQQCRVYASQVLAQQDIYDDDDLRDTVRDTYLDMQGGDLVTPPAGQAGAVQISAVDCNTPETGAWFCDAVARAYDGMKVAVDQMRGNHEQQGCPGESIEFLSAQLDFATAIAGKAAALADRFRAHAAKLADALDTNDLRGTQNGRYARAGA